MPAVTDAESDMARGNMLMQGVSGCGGKYSNIGKGGGERLTKGSGASRGGEGKTLMVESNERVQPRCLVIVRRGG